MRNYGYAGRLYPVNPKLSDIDGIKAYPNLTALPEQVDLVIVSVPAPFVPDVLRECVATGNKTVHIFTSGFKESGEEEGIRLQKEMEKIALTGGLRIIGPNCMGFYVPKTRLLTWTKASKESGPVAFISQSGGNAQDFTNYTTIVGPAADRELRLLVTEPRGRADHDAMKSVRAFAAGGVDHHAHRERRAIFVRPQRAQIVGDALRQHRHDAVGEIDRIAAFDRGAVERRAGPHIMRDVGDRDGHHMAARVARVGVGQGVDGVVMVLGVGRVDGDERGVAPVFVRAEHARARGVGFRQHGGAETMRNAVGVDRDQAHRLFARERAEPLDHLAGRQPEPALARDLDGDEVAVLCAAGRVGRDADFPAELFLVDRHQTDAAVRHAAKNAERAVLGAVDQLDDAAARAVFVRALDADERAVADAGDFAGLGATRLPL